jgi:hypothetical protein
MLLVGHARLLAALNGEVSRFDAPRKWAVGLLRHKVAIISERGVHRMVGFTPVLAGPSREACVPFLLLKD